MRELPPIGLLREIFDLKDGRLFWRVQRKGMNRPSVGLDAGHKHSGGYRVVSIGGRLFFEHRVVFAMTHGRWPTGEIDHINMRRADNRPENLREATHSQNLFNKPKYGNNTSGIKGISWHKASKKWMACISAQGKNIYLGIHEDIELAELIRECAAEKYHGEFVRHHHAA
jgi:hypothetical protein